MASKVEKRRREIMHIIQTDGVANVNEMSHLFQVTSETIRNDFDYLAKEEGYLRTHGGIKSQAIQGVDHGFLFEDRKMMYVDEKKRICYRSIDLIEDGECIFVDGGSTTSYVLNYINRRIGITFVTPSVSLLMKYMLDGYDAVFKEKGHQFIFVGGAVDAESPTTHGAFFDKTIEGFNFDTMLTSFDGVDPMGGCSNETEVAYKMSSRIKQQAKRRFALVDHSKFLITKRFRTMDWKEVDYLISDAPLSEAWETSLKDNEVSYYQV